MLAIRDSRFPNWVADIEKGEIYSISDDKNIGSIDNNGYVRVSQIKGYTQNRLHQYIWMIAMGEDIPEGYDIHHKDGNRQNNSIYNLGLVEHKKHISEHHKGKKRTEETRNKISESNKGKKHTEETKIHLSEIKEKKPIAQYTLDGELVKIWESSCECKRNGYHKSSVTDCCRGKQKTHKGFIWKYLK